MNDYKEKEKEKETRAGDKNAFSLIKNALNKTESQIKNEVEKSIQNIWKVEKPIIIAEISQKLGISVHDLESQMKQPKKRGRPRKY